MIQCESDKPRCKKKAVCYILLKGMKAPGAQEAALAACCAEHANRMLYGDKRSLDQANLTLEDAFINGWGLLTENYRVFFLTDEMHKRADDTIDEFVAAIEKGRTDEAD